MRLSHNMIFKNNLSSILNNQQEVNKAQEQITTQKRVLSASDDPSAMARAMLYGDKIKVNEQYSKNTTMLNSRLETQESVLENIKDSLFRANQLAIKAGNGSQSFSDRQSIAEEIDTITSAVFSWMNSKSEDGRYIFSGYQDNTQTYSYDNTQGKYVYNVNVTDINGYTSPCVSGLVFVDRSFGSPHEKGVQDSDDVQVDDVFY